MTTSRAQCVLAPNASPMTLEGTNTWLVAEPGARRAVVIDPCPADSLTFHLPAEGAVLTGDTILGRGTTVVAHPDGKLGAYLGSLRRLRALCDEAGIETVLPGHGPVLGNAAGVLDYYLTHRAERL